MSVPLVAVFGSARLRPGDPEYEDAREVGRGVALRGWSLCTGGYHGAMEAASRGASSAGGHVVGVTVSMWAERLSANPWVAEERAADGLIARLSELLQSDAWVAVAGGVGTLAEVALAWNLLQTGDVGDRPLVLVGPRWRALLPLLRRHLVIGDRDLALLRVVDDAPAAVAALADVLEGP